MKTFDLTTINVEQLPELKGWKEKQEQIVKDNPYIEVTNHATYTEAKKRRTALVSARTEIQKQDKVLATKIKDFRNKVKQVSDSLIAITEPHEIKQQEEVKRYEAEKETERQERERKERERVEGIKERINHIYNAIKQEINAYTWECVQKVDIEEKLSKIERGQFQEFVSDFETKADDLKELFAEKFTALENEERQRIEREKLAEERRKLEEERKKAEEERRKLEEEQRKAQALIDEENRKKEEALRKEREVIEKEKRRLAEIEAERKAKEEAERRAKEEAERKAKEEQEAKARAEAEAKRLEALKPDAEKLENFIKSISFKPIEGELNTEEAKEFYKNATKEIENYKEYLLTELAKL